VDPSGIINNIFIKSLSGRIVWSVHKVCPHVDCYITCDHDVCISFHFVGKYNFNSIQFNIANIVNSAYRLPIAGS